MAFWLWILNVLLWLYVDDGMPWHDKSQKYKNSPWCPILRWGVHQEVLLLGCKSEPESWTQTDYIHVATCFIESRLYVVDCPWTRRSNRGILLWCDRGNDWREVVAPEGVLVQWWSVLNYVGVFLVSWANVISFHLLRPQPQSCVMCHGSCSGITPVHHQCCNGICPGALECSRSTDVARAISNRSVSNLFSCIATYGGQTHCWKCDIAAGRVVHTYIYIPEPGPGPNLTHHKPMVSPYH